MTTKKRVRHARGSQAGRNIINACGNMPPINAWAQKRLQRINAIDFSLTGMELIRLGLYDGFQTRTISNCYRFHLFLMSDPFAVLAPADQVAEFWHLDILDTRRYQQTCEAIGAGFIHHEFEPVPGTPSYEEATARWQAAMQLLMDPLPEWFTYTGETRC